jgi:hypothetical protein
MPDRWRLVDDLFHRARELSVPDRAAFLDDACGADPELRAELDSLLAEDRGGSSFCTGCRRPVSRSARLTVGAASPRSMSVIGRIRRGTIRPAPEWVGCSIGAADPVRRNCPGLASRSTARRTTSQD